MATISAPERTDYETQSTSVATFDAITQMAQQETVDFRTAHFMVLYGAHYREALHNADTAYNNAQYDVEHAVVLGDN